MSNGLKNEEKKNGTCKKTKFYQKNESFYKNFELVLWFALLSKTSQNLALNEAFEISEIGPRLSQAICKTYHGTSIDTLTSILAHTIQHEVKSFSSSLHDPKI